MEISKEKKELALKYAEENHKEHGMSCSESVFNALIRSKILDLPEDYTRLATGLSGGVAASGNTCGAIYGGLMALGWVYGRKNPHGEAKIDNTSSPQDKTEDYRYYMLRRFNCFVHEVEEKIGTTTCRDIVNAKGGYFDDKRVMACPDIIIEATRITLKYLEMSDEENKRLAFGYNTLGYE